MPDEIGFVDSLIAATHKNIKVVQYAFENYAVQRNYDLSLATHSWILFFRLMKDLQLT
jgi:hypothetical protein